MSTTKVDPAKMAKVITPELTKLVQMFKAYNYEIRIAGGAVRDLLSEEKIPDDVDLATTAIPSQMKEMFTKEGIRMINEQGEKHGTITARIDDKENFEVTTLRIDKTTDGRFAEVEFTTDWKIDAERRDLTINSMFLEMDGTIIDYFNGRSDLEMRRVAFVGSADKRIKEDFLRILRYFRFYGRIAQEENGHEDETMLAIKENANGLQRISGERIWMEWRKILAGPMGGPMTTKMIELGCGPYIGLPTDPNLNAFQSLWQDKGGSVHPVTLLSQLLKTPEEMTNLNTRLKMSAFERDLGYFLIEHRNSPVDLKFWQKTLILSKNKASFVREWIIQALTCRENAEQTLKDFQAWEVPRFPVNGKDLKDHGVPTGRGMGFCIDRLKESWIESDFKYDSQHLIQVELPKAMDAYQPDIKPPSPKLPKNKKAK